MIREIAASRPNEHIYQSDRGRLIIRKYGNSALLFIEQGFLEKGFVHHIERVQNEVVQSGGKPSIFVDAENLEGYEPELQTSATQWIKANKALVTAQHMLVRSRLTQLGVSVASLALGAVIKGYTSRSQFEAALRQAVGDADVEL